MTSHIMYCLYSEEGAEYGGRIKQSEPEFSFGITKQLISCVIY